MLYRNDLDNGHHWLIVKCTGTNSNQSGIGAIVKLTATLDGREMTQTRVIGTNNTFLGDNDIRAHFGLRDAAVISQLEIRWPSGQVDQYQNVNADQLLEAIEGKSLK